MGFVSPETTVAPLMKASLKYPIFQPQALLKVQKRRTPRPDILNPLKAHDRV